MTALTVLVPILGSRIAFIIGTRFMPWFIGGWALGQALAWWLV
jgi:hypothetical protein